MKIRKSPAPLQKNNSFDADIVEKCPAYAKTFTNLGRPDVALVCRKGPMVTAAMAVTERKSIAKALYTLADVLGDDDDSYSIGRLADRVLGFSAEDEENGESPERDLA